jgi:hypothetical protein
MASSLGKWTTSAEADRQRGRHAPPSQRQLRWLCGRHDRDLLKVDALRQAHRECDGLGDVFGFEPLELCLGALEPIDGALVFRISAPEAPTATFYPAALILVGAGEKQGTLRDESFAYNADHYLVVTSPLPKPKSMLKFTRPNGGESWHEARSYPGILPAVPR